MKTNRFFSIIALIFILMLGMSACNDDDTSSDAPYFTLGVEGGGNPPASLVLNTDAFTQSFTVKSNGSWKIVAQGESTSWVTVSPDRGDHDGSFTISVDRNIDTVKRSMQFAFQVNDKELRAFYVAQPAFGPNITVTTIQDDAIVLEDDTLIVNIATNADVWEYSNTNDWLREVEKTATTLKLLVLEGDELTAPVTFSLPAYPGVTQEIIVKKLVPLEKIDLSELSLELITGDKALMTATPVPANATGVNFVWTSANPNIATVSSTGPTTGTITAVAHGKTTVTIRSDDVETVIPVNVTQKMFVIDIASKFGNGLTVLLKSPEGQLAEFFYTNMNWKPASKILPVVPGQSFHITDYEDGPLSYNTLIIQENDTIRVGPVTYTGAINDYTTYLYADTYAWPYAGDFDLGGDGVGFHDSDYNHDGGDGANYRRARGDTRSDAMDIEHGEGYGDIGYSNPGEWLMYTVYVVDAGTYTIDWNISVNGSTAACHIEVDGVTVGKARYDLDNDGSWNAWHNYCESKGVTPPTIYLTEGRHKVKYYYDGGVHNFNGLYFNYKP
jgi:hypothetical protein